MIQALDITNPNEKSFKETMRSIVRSEDIESDLCSCQGRAKALRQETSLLSARKSTGGNDGEVPPVPIPNTVVKLSSAESTWLDTAREDRSLPVPLKASHF